MRIYSGTLLIALTTLALEISLARLLSVITWYHLGFFAIATAMLGMTAGATTVYLRPDWFGRNKTSAKISEACLAYALILPFALIILSLLPLSFPTSAISFAYLVLATIVCSVPFYFSGIAISAVLTKCRQPIGKLYATDLIGASAGCLLVLGGLWLFDAPSLILICAAIGALAAFSFARDHGTGKILPVSGAAFVVLIFVALVNATLVKSAAPIAIRPLVAKQTIQDPANHLLERWNSFSQVVVFKQKNEPPQYWGASPHAPLDNLPQYKMQIDGDAATTVRRFSTPEDIEHLKYDVTNVAYYLRPRGGAAVVGLGGGRDLQSALLFGHERVVGIDVNPIFVELLQNEFRDFAGIADHPDVELVVDEARGYLSRTPDRYTLIQMSLIDTWASTGAGAFSLSENGLYTVEAWRVFFSRLDEAGIFTVSRWHNPHFLGETGRVVSLAVATLLDAGVEDPTQHIAMVTTDGLATLLVSKEPFTPQDIEILQQLSADLEFSLVIVPGTAPKDDTLREIISAKSLDRLLAVVEDKPLNYVPSTDESPYFFNMLRLQYLDTILQSGAGITYGNMTATLTLVGLILSLLVLTIATIFVPLYIKERRQGGSSQRSVVFWSGALYFSLIGAGFMFVEIALIQRLSVFLTHPVYALGILLFTIIASTGVGSFLSEHLPLTRYPLLFIYPIATVLAILGIRFLLSMILANAITAPLSLKIVISIAVIFPLGVLLGFFFPTGMRLVGAVSASDTPWYWALNGIFGVLSSAVAVFVSIYIGISFNFHIAMGCYAAVLVSIYHFYSVRQKRQETIRITQAQAEA